MNREREIGRQTLIQVTTQIRVIPNQVSMYNFGLHSIHVKY